MKRLGICIVILFCASAGAQEKDRPFVLDDGRYAFECWGLEIKSQTATELKRDQKYQKGTQTVSTANGTTAEILNFESEDGIHKYSLERATSTANIGNGFFMQTVTVKGEERSAVFEITLKAEGNSNTIVSVRSNGKSLKANSREVFWKRMGDGRVFAQDYFLPTPTELFSSTTCLFLPQK